MFVISESVTVPAAMEFDFKGGRWFFRCVICHGWTRRKNRWTLAGAHICEGCALDHNATGDALSLAYTTEREETARRERQDAIRDMADYCGVSSPDSDSSPGADWLYRLHRAVSEAWESGQFAPNSGEDRTEVFSRIADDQVPTYTHNRWQAFMNLCLYNEEIDEFSEGIEVKDSTDLTNLAGIIFFEVAYRGASNWFSEKCEDSKCEKCDEFPCECCEECGEYFDCACATDE